MKDTFDKFHPPDRGLFGDNEQASRVTGRSDLVDVPCVLHVDTARNGHVGAVLVSADGDEHRAQWIPHSRCRGFRNDS